MRFQGRVVEWNDARGFGFIAPNGGGAKVFFHISTLDRRGTRPSLGALVTYEVGSSNDGRAKANAVRFVDGRRTGRVERKAVLLPAVGLVLFFSAVAYVASVRLSHPNSTVSASVYKVLFAREALRASPDFQCSPEKSACSRMTSCAEALFHQEQCAVPNMDGDRDGIPCEEQWCN